MKALVAHARTSRSQTRRPHFILRSAYKLPANFQPQRCRRRSARSNTRTMASKLAGGEVVLDHGTFKANQPPLAPKRKLKIDRKKSNVEWQWAPFTNQAREDGTNSASFRLLTPSPRLVSIRRGRGWFFERFWAVSDRVGTLHRSGPPPLAKKRRGICRVPLRALQHETRTSYLY